MIQLDFCIIGVQKAGTTTLAAQLDGLEDVCMARPKEPMFFCYDDYVVHQKEFLHVGERWSSLQWERDQDSLLNAYQKCYSHYQEGQLIGEASTTYAPSILACERLSALYPNLKVVVVLRDPIQRAVSAYWHTVRRGVATRSLENELMFGSPSYLTFGFYFEQLKRYIAAFGRENLCVIHFDDLVRDQTGTICRLMDFLGRPISAEALGNIQNVRENRSYYPTFPRIHSMVSRTARSLKKTGKASSLGFDYGNESPSVNENAASFYRKCFMRRKAPLPTCPRTLKMMRELFMRQNMDLDKLLGEDVFSRWNWK
ncbi:sulfotransferase domain-containing protein [Roseibacillus persicicus]|uniref:sulfotransferase domain-containing protein n=1 Tax=Roseibacillus persicicus TaxID=454148 RepID=UPI00398B5429